MTDPIKAMLMKSFIIILLLPQKTNSACPNTFPTDNTALTNAGDFQTFTDPLAGALTSSSLTCTTAGDTADAFYYG